MSESSNGDGATSDPADEPGAAAPPIAAAVSGTGDAGAARVPPTRPNSAVSIANAPPEASLALDALGAPPVTFPDDGPLSAGVRKLDDLLGRVEQGLVFGLLALVVLVAAFAALHDRLSSDHIGRWWHYIVRGGTFATAMFAAVFATQQQRHLAMDLVSRRLTPRGRLMLGVALKLLTIGVAALLFQSGLHQRAVAGGSDSLDFLGLHIIDADIVSTISIGAALIALHSLLHLVIDVDYLVRDKLPPERARSGH